MPGISRTGYHSSFLYMAVAMVARFFPQRPKRIKPSSIAVYDHREFGEGLSMTVEDTRRLFDQWERVWHESQYGMVAECVAPAYVRHDESGTRTVTPAEYAAELEAGHKARPNTRITVYDHEFTADRAWFRFNLTWIDAATGEKRSRAGMQSYLIEGGKLAETWLSVLALGTAWPDVGRLERWTSPRKSN